MAVSPAIVSGDGRLTPGNSPYRRLRVAFREMLQQSAGESEFGSCHRKFDRPFRTALKCNVCISYT